MGVEEEPKGRVEGEKEEAAEEEEVKQQRGSQTNRNIMRRPHCRWLVFSRSEAHFMRWATSVVLMDRPGTTLQYLVL